MHSMQTVCVTKFWKFQNIIRAASIYLLSYILNVITVYWVVFEVK